LQNKEGIRRIALTEQELARSDPGEIGQLVQFDERLFAEGREQRQRAQRFEAGTH
jgi:hypothetical protein